MKKLGPKIRHDAKAYQDFFSGLEEDLETLKENHLYRECKVVERTSGKTRIKNQEVILFCGNDYLGLSTHPRLVRSASEALTRYGVGSGAARLISGTLPVHDQLENRLADFKNKEKAVLFTTGYMANLGTLTALCKPGDLIVMDKLCHASLVDGARLSGAGMRVFPHKNYNRCLEILKTEKTSGRKFIISDTVFSMDGDFADIEALIRLKKETKSVLILDDAHGTGVLGKSGRGLTEGFEPSIDVILGTLSKAFGCVGGFAAGSTALAEYLVNHARPFIFATSLPPSVCAAAIEAVEILEKDQGLRKNLWKNVERLREGLRKLGLSIEETPSPVTTVILGAEKTALEVSRELFERGFFIPAVRTPTVPKGKARLRITVSAAHDPKDMERMIAVLGDILKSHALAARLSI